MIVLHATFPIDPESREEALAFFEELVERSQAEDGILEYQATTEIGDENVVRFVERYEDEAAFEAHTETEQFQAFEDAIGGWLAGEPEIVRFEVEEAVEIEL